MNHQYGLRTTPSIFNLCCSIQHQFYRFFYPSVSDRRTTSIMCADSDLTGWLQAAVLLSSIHPRISALLHRALLRCPTSQPAGLDFLTCSLHCVFLTELITP